MKRELSDELQNHQACMKEHTKVTLNLLFAVFTFNGPFDNELYNLQMNLIVLKRCSCLSSYVALLFLTKLKQFPAIMDWGVYISILTLVYNKQSPEVNVHRFQASVFLDPLPCTTHATCWKYWTKKFINPKG